MSGSSSERVRMRFLPEGTQVLQTKDLSFNKETYDVSTNAVRLAFGIPQSEVGETPSGGLGGSGYAEAMQSSFYRMGISPMLSYIESHFNDIIMFNHDEGYHFKLEFPPETINPEKEEQKWSERFQIGGISRDEYRQGVGLQPLGGDLGDFIVPIGGGGGYGDGIAGLEDLGMNLGAAGGNTGSGSPEKIKINPRRRYIPVRSTGKNLKETLKKIEDDSLAPAKMTNLSDGEILEIAHGMNYTGEDDEIIE
jgi:hypothetical protein